jgi:hypothetical protein
MHTFDSGDIHPTVKLNQLSSHMQSPPAPMSLQLPAPRPWHLHPHPARHARGSPVASWGARWRAAAAVAAVQHLVARRGKLPGTEIQSKAPEGETYEERWEWIGDGWGMGSHC